MTLALPFRSSTQDLAQRLTFRKSMPSLNVMRLVLERLHASSPLRIDPSRVVVIAGTNGKGTTAAILERLIRNTGASTGLYTSPHLISVCERIRFDGKPISDADFERLYAEVFLLTEDLKLTHFEMLTAVAAYAFYSNPPTAHDPDWTILEVGLGGRYDATNAIAHDTAVITRLGLDHCEVLGSTEIEIAKNKFGIAQFAKQVIYTELSELVQNWAQSTGVLDERWIRAEPFDLLHDTNSTQIITPWGKTTLALPGRRAAENALTALTTFSALGFDVAKNLHACNEVVWPGRFEIFKFHDTRIALSGDHNPQGIDSLIEILNSLQLRKVHFVMGVAAQKNYSEMLQPIMSYPNSELWMTETPFRPRPLSDFEHLRELVHLDHYGNPIEALTTAARGLGKQDLVVVTGSLYLVGEIRKHLICNLTEPQPVVYNQTTP